LALIVVMREAVALATLWPLAQCRTAL